MRRNVFKKPIALWFILSLFCNTLFATESTTQQPLDKFNQLKVAQFLKKNKNQYPNRQSIKQRLSTLKPQQVYLARLLLIKPLNKAQLVSITRDNKITAIQAQAQTPLPQTGTTLTIWFRDLYAYDDTLIGALNYFEKRHQNTLKQQIKTTKYQNQVTLQQDLKQQMESIYYVELQIVTTADDLKKLANHHNIYSVLPVKQSHFDFTKAKEQLRRPNRSSNYKAKSFSGDLQSQHLIKNKQQHLCGYRANIPTEVNCPPDSYWVPSPEFSSGAENSVTSTIKNWSPIFDNPDFAEQYDPIKAYDHRYWSEGTFSSWFLWSRDPQNTAAFNNASLYHCNPELNFGKLTAKCDKDQLDAIYVPDSTYEDEGLIPNRSCATTRTGTSWDRVAGCYVTDYSYTNLPYGYLDTAISDSARTFVATVGSYHAMDIKAGISYVHHHEFWAWKTNNIVQSEDKLNHNGQIGTDYCFGSNAQFCTLAVDTTPIHKNLIYVPVTTLATPTRF